MSTHRPETIEELIAYVRRQLGDDSADGATVEVDVTENQFRDKIYAAIQLWQTFAYDGEKLKIFVIPASAFESGGGTVVLPSETMAVIGYVDVGASGGRERMFDWDFQWAQSFAMDYMAGGNILSLDLSRSYVKLMQQRLAKSNDIHFNGATKELYITNSRLIGAAIAVVAYVYVDEEHYGNVFNDVWIKRYVEAAVRKQWGMNLLMYTDVRLPGGVGLNAQALFESGREEMEKLEEELRSTWQRPPKFRVR